MITHIQLMDLQEMIPGNQIDHIYGTDEEMNQCEIDDIEECAKMIHAKFILHKIGRYDQDWLEALRLTEPCNGLFCYDCKVKTWCDAR